MLSNVHILQIGVSFLITVANCEVFTAVTNVENLLHTLENVLGNLNQYVEIEENRLNILNRYLKVFTNDHETAIKDAQKYVQNPINAFTLIKRLSTDFERIKTVASDPTEFVWDRELLYPTDDDLTAAAVAIARLQLFYKLNTTHLPDGNLMDDFGSSMTASDCYNLAVILYNNKVPYAAEWYEAALEKLNNKQYDNPFTATEIMKYIVDNSEDGIWNHYRELCRGETNITSANSSKLHCFYLKSSPFLRLAPIKMEELHKKPDIFLFHGVLSDSEIKILKDIAGPKLKRVSVGDDVNKMNSEVRIGKSAWLDEYNDTVERLKQRTADFTGLSMSYTEPLKVLNYGKGGHYKLNYNATDDPNIYRRLGNRIATVLFYMSNVDQGGATVFPRLHMAVRPKKGTALYWMNLYPSAEIDKRTLHVACPVLYGYTWVANMWIREPGHEFLRPCPLEANEY